MFLVIESLSIDIDPFLQCQVVTITVSIARVRACGDRCVERCGTGTVSRVSGKAIDRFQCTWIAMIDEIYKLIAEYLGNGFR